LLALAEFDPLDVVITLACCYAVTLLALIGIETCEAQEPDVDWPAVRWRAGACAALFVGFPAACAISTGASLQVTLLMALCCPRVVRQVRRFADNSRRWTSVPGPRPGPARHRPSASTSEKVTRLLELGPTPGLISAMDTATLCAAWQRSFRMLTAASTVAERALVAHLRQLYLDELERRHPSSLAHWLATHPTASSGPDRFLPGA
jgi:hypothetical protein